MLGFGHLAGEKVLIECTDDLLDLCCQHFLCTLISELCIYPFALAFAIIVLEIKDHILFSVFTCDDVLLLSFEIPPMLKAVEKSAVDYFIVAQSDGKCKGFLPTL